MGLTIKENILTNNDCYKSGRTITPIGMQLHTIGTGQNTASSLASYWNQPGVSCCVHYCIDAEQENLVYHLLPDNYRSWADGGFGNGNLITVELMESDYMKYTGGASYTITDTVKFKADITRAYKTAVQFFAQKCKQYGWNPTAKLANGLYVISSHDEGRRLGVSTSHVDPTHIWGKLGFTMDQFRADVKSAMNGKTSTVKPASPYVTWTCKTKTADAVLRKGAGKTKAAIKTLKKGSVMTVIGEKKSTTGNLWYKVKCRDVTGYVYHSKVAPVDRSVRVTSNDLIIRSGAGTSYSKRGYTGKGTFTVVREKKGSDGHTWGLLKAFEKSKDGWIALDLSCVTRID